LGTAVAVSNVSRAWAAAFEGQLGSQQLSLTFLKTVSTMLEAVVFFLVGVGLYSLFLAPLKLAVALGVDTLNDLEERVTSVVVAILA